MIRPQGKKDPPLVSVVMTVYEPHPEYFPLAVQSILRQTLADLELIIVEDPSPRSGQALLAGLNDRRVRHLVNSHRTSLVDQKNQGITAARGKFVAIFDADDISEPHRLQKQADFLRAHPEVGVVGSQIHVIDARGQVCGYRLFPTEHPDILRAMPRIVPLSQPSVMIRRQLLLQAGGYRYKDHVAPEDYELWSRLAWQGVRFANLPEPLIRYRMHSGQMKARFLRETIRGVLHVKRLYWRNQMAWQDWLRMLGERLLLLLPSWLVLHLLVLTEYRHRVQSASRSPYPSAVPDRAAGAALPVVGRVSARPAAPSAAVGQC